MPQNRVPCTNPAHGVTYHIAGSQEAAACQPTGATRGRSALPPVSSATSVQPTGDVGDYQTLMDDITREVPDAEVTDFTPGKRATGGGKNLASPYTSFAVRIDGVPAFRYSEEVGLQYEPPARQGGIPTDHAREVAMRVIDAAGDRFTPPASAGYAYDDDPTVEPGVIVLGDHTFRYDANGVYAGTPDAPAYEGPDGWRNPHPDKPYFPKMMTEEEYHGYDTGLRTYAGALEQLKDFDVLPAPSFVMEQDGTYSVAYLRGSGSLRGDGAGNLRVVPSADYDADTIAPIEERLRAAGHVVAPFSEDDARFVAKEQAARARRQREGKSTRK